MKGMFGYIVLQFRAEIRLSHKLDARCILQLQPSDGNFQNYFLLCDISFKRLNRDLQSIFA